MKKDWIADAGLLVFSVAVFLFLLRLHPQANLTIATGVASFFMAARLGFSLGKYFSLGLQVSDKDLKNNALFSVDRILFDDHVLMHEMCGGKHFKGQMVQIANRREFDTMKNLLEKERFCSLVKLRRGSYKTHEWFFASSLTPEKAKEKLCGYAVTSTKNPEVFIAPNGEMNHVKPLLAIR